MIFWIYVCVSEPKKDTGVNISDKVEARLHMIDRVGAFVGTTSLGNIGNKSELVMVEYLQLR